MKMAKPVKEKERLFVKQIDLSDIFGKIKTGMTGQEFKDEARKGWKEKRFSDK
ncbi:hypothetical protein HYV82_03340 [Candidatus Woesearchaeota archaeon]|nr:hypothetical protein [Candidatus Woesearchaeota archaeon]